MNILYFGTVCDFDHYNDILKSCSQKPSVAPILFESALLNGFKKHDLNIEVHCFPMIPTFPKCKLLFFGGNTERLNNGYNCRWLKTINIPVFKQISRNQDARKVLREWGKKNKDNGIVFTYSIPPFLANDIIRYKNKYGFKTIAIIPDLLRDMYINEDSKSLITKIKHAYIKPALEAQSAFDGYIYLTEDMHNIVAPDKPYIVMEGIANVNEVDVSHKGLKSEKISIMYAGMLHEKYGILNLVDAFEKLENENLELWLFGSGTAVSIIEKYAKKDRRIKYFGTIPHEEIIEYERRAHLLVNPRDPNDEFTFYSFPSKTIEYMLSGTPLLTTKLKGIPSEYYEYVYSIEDNTVDTIKEALNKILKLSNDDLKKKGVLAQKYIIKEKNSYIQTEKIKKFMEGIL